MESVMKLFYEWEIQLLVLLSFTLQMFLFFVGSLRRRSTNMFLRFFIWIAYLGADLVAVYALGYLSRHDDTTDGRHIPRRTQPLAFFWSPFLLMHLGGQDTITAFAMEDNNLWLRHLLNLAVQVILALYVFWKSIGRHSVVLLVSSIFVFVAGIIKYGERTWALQRGSLDSLENCTGYRYKKRLPQVMDGGAGYPNIVCAGLRSMKHVLNIFAARSLFVNSPGPHDAAALAAEEEDPNKMLKVVELELAMMYDDLYTKALVLRTRTGIVLRCISHISVVAAFGFFLASNKGMYRVADTAITYVLFIGAMFLEMCALLIFVMSPWTWAGLKARNWDKLASLSWFLFSGCIGWPEKKPQWSRLMGQYSYLSWLTGDKYPRSSSRRVMTVASWVVDLVGAEKKSLFRMSKLLHPEYVEVDKMTMECVFKGFKQLNDEFSSRQPREWPILGDVLKEIRNFLLADFGLSIISMHVVTEIHLSKYHHPSPSPPPPPSDMEANAAAAETKTVNATIDDMVEVCRKLSNYMMYLLVTQPSMLPLNVSAAATLQEWFTARREDFVESCGEYVPKPGREALEEMVDVWTRLLLYAAGKSRAETHAARLSSGGELITFAWLLLARNRLGDSEIRRIRIANVHASDQLEAVFAFYFDEPATSLS